MRVNGKVKLEDLDDSQVPCIRRRLAKPKSPKTQFFQISVLDLQAWIGSDVARRADRTTVVWLMLLNAFRALKKDEIKFTPRWRDIKISQSALYRSLDRLQDAGLIEVTRRRGKSPNVRRLYPDREVSHGG